MYTGVIAYKGVEWKLWAKSAEDVQRAVAKITYLVDIIDGNFHKELREFTGYKVQYLGKVGL